MKSKVIDQIRKEIGKRTVEELVAIYRAHDTGEWSEEAFEAIRQTLQSKGVSLPEVIPTTRIRGFANIALVNLSLRELCFRLTPERLRQFNHNFVLTPHECGSLGDPVIRVQEIARRLADHYRIRVTTVVVTFLSDLKSPGRVELSPSSVFFVELRSDLRESENAIVAVLAHEIAHIFLYREGIRLIPTFHNEVLTDTTAAFLGCGLTILNGWTVRKSILGNSIETQWNHFGYLSLDEFGYVQAKRDAFFDSSPVHRFQYALPQSGFREGQRRLKMELRKRPFVRPFIFKRVGMALAVFIRKGRRLEEPKSLTFPCAICSQSLRIPLLGSRMSVHCPTCGTTLLCYS